MSIDSAMRQQKFRSDYQKAITNLISTHNWVLERFKSHLDSFNITNQQFNILKILRSAGKPLSTMQIRERMLDKMSDTSRIVDRLVAKEFVSKSVSLLDKRLVDVVISDKGLGLLAEIEKEEQQMDEIFGHLSLAEVQELNRLLDKIRHEDEVPVSVFGVSSL